MFGTGMFINITSDSILTSLKVKDDDDYKIPHGGLFTLISTPNYFGEIIEWIAFSFLGGKFAQAAFAFFTIANLVPRAISHHK